MIPFHPHAPPPLPLETAVKGLWRFSGRTPKTISEYVVWPRRFYAYCAAARMDPLRELSLAGVKRFWDRYIGPRSGRHLDREGRRCARVALRAWSCALKILGHSVPDWEEPPVPPVLPKLLAEYREFRIQHRGVSASTLHRDRETAEMFLACLRSRRRPLAQARLKDIDFFITHLARRWSKKTVSCACSSLRCFLRYLHSTGTLKHDLASLVVAPQTKPMDSPPRALPWPIVRRLLRGVRRDGPTGCRDYAILLLMAAYGMGAAEVIALDLEDIDWANQILRIRRPKTGVPVLLPLLPAVARALAEYLQRERPPHAASRGVFVRKDVPHLRISSSSSLFYMVKKHARAAGIKIEHLGTHALRHSHASRQVDSGASLKVVSDILGHRDPASTSVYVRVALRRLRQAALPVPR